MAALEDHLGYGSRCHKLRGRGLWRCNLLAMSGKPFCEKHYALKVKKLQHIINGEFLSSDDDAVSKKRVRGRPEKVETKQGLNRESGRGKRKDLGRNAPRKSATSDTESSSPGTGGTPAQS